LTVSCEGSRRRAIEWLLTTHGLDINNAIRHARPAQPVNAAPSPHDQVSQTLYDTGLTAEEGLWSRTGHVH
jgi:hypothetical protein